MEESDGVQACRVCVDVHEAPVRVGWCPGGLGFGASSLECLCSSVKPRGQRTLRSDLGSRVVLRLSVKVGR